MYTVKLGKPQLYLNKKFSFVTTDTSGNRNILNNKIQRCYIPKHIDNPH